MSMCMGGGLRMRGGRVFRYVYVCKGGTEAGRREGCQVCLYVGGGLRIRGGD